MEFLLDSIKGKGKWVRMLFGNSKSIHFKGNG